MPWSRRFDEPIQPPKGKKLVTLKDAAAYILALPKSKQQSPEWQAAGEAVIMAAEDRGPPMHAHVGMMLALHGAKPIPEYDSSKERHWGKRKLKRDEGWETASQLCRFDGLRGAQFGRSTSLGRRRAQPRGIEGAWPGRLSRPAVKPSRRAIPCPAHPSTLSERSHRRPSALPARPPSDGRTKPAAPPTQHRRNARQFLLC
jgi:hypothetical protein